VPRSRAMHRSVRRVNLLERCCERTRTGRRRTLCERRRLRYAAAILLRQGGEIAPAPWRSRPDPSDVGALRGSFRRDHREPRHRATPSQGVTSKRDETSHSHRFPSGHPSRGPRRAASLARVSLPRSRGCNAFGDRCELAPRRSRGIFRLRLSSNIPAPSRANARSSDRLLLVANCDLARTRGSPFLFVIISPTPTPPPSCSLPHSSQRET
jgi:hypothetical protein